MNPISAPIHPDALNEIDLRIQPGQTQEIKVQAGPGGAVVIHSQPRVERWYAWISVLLAAMVILTGLARYPSQVMPEEVYPSLRAAELIANGFKGPDGALLPAFLPGSTPFGVGTNAWLQVLPQLVRPNTLLWIRGCNALLALLAGLLLAYWLREGLKLKSAWLAMPLLAGIPAWFTLARSGLDIALATSLLTAALASYGLYRAGRTKWIYTAVAFAWLGFYAHPAARLAVPAAVLLLIAIDWRYHRLQRVLMLRALGMGILMAIPLIIFLTRHPDGILQELATAGSYLVNSGSGWRKAGKFLLAMVESVNPFRWLLVDSSLPTAVQTGPYPPLPWLLAPFLVIGGWKASKSSAYRLAWVGLLAAAIGAAPFGGTLPNSLLTVPLLAVLILIGLQFALEWLKTRWKRLPDGLLAPLLLAALAGSSLVLLISALNPGQRWQVNYGRQGLQYGAPQIFAAASEYTDSRLERSVWVWPEWSRDPEALRRFFAPERGDRIQSGAVDAFLYEKRADIETLAFLLPTEQYQTVKDSGKFTTTTVDEILYPDGKPAFYLVELVYTPQFETLLVQETAQRHALVKSEIVLGGETVTVLHSVLDIGEPVYLFDQFDSSLVRTAAANPLVIELNFPAPRSLRGVKLELGAEPITVTALVTIAETGSTQTFRQQAAASSDMKQVQLDFGTVLPVQSLRLEVVNEAAGDPGHVHLWEIELLE